MSDGKQNGLVSLEEKTGGMFQFFQAALPNPTDWVGCKQQILTFHSFGGGKSKVMALADPVSDGSLDSCLLTVTSPRGKGKRGLLYKGTNPIHRGSAFKTSSPPKVPTS